MKATTQTHIEKALRIVRAEAEYQRNADDPVHDAALSNAAAHLKEALKESAAADVSTPPIAAGEHHQRPRP